MHTLVQTPQEIFTLPQHLTVPLFQRPYVWNEEDQLGPLWSDIRRVAEIRMSNGSAGATHFLGAVVLQQQVSSMGAVSAFAVIDGQQRLTTLQLLMDATAEVLGSLDHEALAQQLFALTHNAAHFGLDEDQLLKVQHTNKDRAAFHEVMNAPPPMDYDALRHQASLIARGHFYFTEEVRAWLTVEGESQVPARATHLVTVLSRGLQLVTITLQPDENSQEIFETLNARGTPLTAADLIKNLVFQRIDAEGGSAAQAYSQRWSLFEHPFWEHEISVGRYQITRISLFLNHWLVARTAEEVGPRSTFTRFKGWVEHESAGRTMSDILDELHAQAQVYQSWIEAASRKDGTDLDNISLFVYRTQAAGIEVIKPVLLWLFDSRRAVPADQQERALAAVESWIMRRALLRLPTSDLSRTTAALIAQLSGVEPELVGQRTEEFLTRQRRRATYWPGDAEMTQELRTSPVYRRYPRALLRMVLETIEDVERGFTGVGGSKTGIRVPRNLMAIEHLLPQRWRTHWPVTGGLADEILRDEHVHRLGNLTLLTGSLNSSLSNGPWSGTKGKRSTLREHDVILMTRRVHDTAQESWHEEDIRLRTDRMIAALLSVWPVPEGHTGEFEDRPATQSESIDLRVLLDAGVLNVGDVLKGRTDNSHLAVIGEQGILRVDDKEFPSPSSAVKHFRGTSTNGWWYWKVADGRSLKEVRQDYVRQMAAAVPDS